MQEQWFCRTANEWLADLRAIAPHLRTLGGVVREFAQAFREAKAAQSAIDFNDLGAVRPASSSATRPPPPTGSSPRMWPGDLRARYREILVDKYPGHQRRAGHDPDPGRPGRAGPPNRFMVGDVKQSIYRFRTRTPASSWQYGAYRPCGRPPNPARLAPASSWGPTSGAGKGW